MGLLSWLGLQRGDGYPNVDAVLLELKRALPEHESVVLRYIAVVVVLLAKVAYADGRFTPEEEEALRGLLSDVERLGPNSIDALCTALRGRASEVKGDELELCYRELKALCDGRERIEVMRLLCQLAAADGAPTPSELAQLEEIAGEIGIPKSELEPALRDALQRLS